MLFQCHKKRSVPDKLSHIFFYFTYTFKQAQYRLMSGVYIVLHNFSRATCVLLKSPSQTSIWKCQLICTSSSLHTFSSLCLSLIWCLSWVKEKETACRHCCPNLYRWIHTCTITGGIMKITIIWTMVRSLKACVLVQFLMPVELKPDCWQRDNPMCLHLTLELNEDDKAQSFEAACSCSLTLELIIFTIL